MSSFLRDELIVIDLEPCDTCAIGISKSRCYDDLRRCQACITALVAERGWNTLHVEPVTVEPEPEPMVKKKKKQKWGQGDGDGEQPSFL